MPSVGAAGAAISGSQFWMKGHELSGKSADWMNLDILPAEQQQNLSDFYQLECLQT